ncbi:MAG: SpoIID/LytB domain-containing protein [Deltaproteobacteria bacterium]|nr:SpoIID/LytB domain-containing protein [Deltaproteobacteria bacterium]
MEEPTIKVGIIELYGKVNGGFNGPYRVNNERLLDGGFAVRAAEDCLILYDDAGNEIMRQREIRCSPLHDATFTLFDVTVGIQFHWQRKEEQTFQGALTLTLSEENTLTAINEIHLEDYLISVISSEMSAEAPLEFLKAHAIISRSWLMAAPDPARTTQETFAVTGNMDFTSVNEIICWYGRGEHALFDVCADDHCQRYQGITRFMSGSPRKAVEATRGVFLTHNDKICDARYHKACGGITDTFDHTWEDTPIPYLSSIPDAPAFYEPVHTEEQATQWLLSSPDVYCNTTDENLLRQILPFFDQGTKDFFRWRVKYRREELEEILRMKSGIDFGDLESLSAVERGPSGRIIRLKVKGSKKTIVVGNELEIRRWLSRSHLYSSAFIVTAGGGSPAAPDHFILHGAGWGHGVGLCQIGAAVMATKGFTAEEILKHYFRGTELQKRY